MISTGLLFREQDTSLKNECRVYNALTLEQKKIEEAKNEFVSLTSHQLRAPLSCVNWFIEMLLAGDAGKLTGLQQEYALAAHRGAQRLEALTTLLLNTHLVELGLVEPDPKPIHIAKLSQKILNKHLALIERDKPLTIKEVYNTSSPTFLGDETLITIILENIYTNALKYTPSGGIINISITNTVASSSALLISVSDTGCGIPVCEQDKIFTKLFRTENSKKIDSLGIGLGLYLTKQAIKKINGSIWFESVENKGSTFYILLPRYQNSATS